MWMICRRRSWHRWTWHQPRWRPATHLQNPRLPRSLWWRWRRRTLWQGWQHHSAKFIQSFQDRRRCSFWPRPSKHGIWRSRRSVTVTPRRRQRRQRHCHHPLQVHPDHAHATPTLCPLPGLQHRLHHDLRPLLDVCHLRPWLVPVH